jgi:hypothetical protein
MIKPNLTVSHDWHVQPYCQRSLRAARLSGALLDRGPGCYAKVSSNLLRMLDLRFTARPNFFHANLLNLSNLPLRVNCLFSSSPRPLQLAVGGYSSRQEANRPTPGKSRFRIALRKNYQTTTSIARAACGSREFPPGSCNGMFSAGPLQGFQGRVTDLARPYEPPPFSLSGQAHTGHREAPLLLSNFSILAQLPCGCNLPADCVRPLVATC